MMKIHQTPLTKRETDCLSALQAFLAYGKSPSIGDLRDAMGVRERGSACRPLTHLMQRGIVRRRHGSLEILIVKGART